MAIAQDYWKIASPRFGRAQLTRDTSQPYLSMTQPLYWAAAGMAVVLASASMVAVGQPQDMGREYLAPLSSSRFTRQQLTRGTAPFLPVPLYFVNSGPLHTTLASAVLAATGYETSLGTLATTLSSVVLAGTGHEKDSGTLATTLAYVVLAGTGHARDNGTLATTLANAVLAGTGTVKDSGTLATTLASVVLAGTGHETDSGTLATTLASAVLASTGVVRDFETLATTLASVVLASTGSVKDSGTLATTLANAVLAATGNEGETGHLATTLASAVLAATGGETVTGTLATTLASVRLAVTGVDYSAKLASVLASASFRATGSIPAIPGMSHPGEDTKSPTYFMEDGDPSAITGYVSGFALNARGFLVSVDDTSQPRAYLWGIPIDSHKRVILAERFTNILFKNGPTTCLFTRVS